jgi:hypothetical protein
MIWFYKRISKDSKMSTIVCNTGMFYLRNITATVGIVACFLNQTIIATIALTILGFLLFRFLFKEEEIIKEIKEQSRKKSETIIYSGNKYSFKDPLTIIIRK